MQIKKPNIYFLKQPIQCVEHWFSLGFRTITLSGLYHSYLNQIPLDLVEFPESNIIKVNNISITDRMYLAEVSNKPVIIVPLWRKPLTNQSPFIPHVAKRWAMVENIAEVIHGIRTSSHETDDNGTTILRVTRATKLDDGFLFFHGFKIEKGKDKYSITRLLEDKQPEYDNAVNDTEFRYNRLIFRKDGRIIFIPKGELYFYTLADRHVVSTTSK